MDHCLVYPQFALFNHLLINDFMNPALSLFLTIFNESAWRSPVSREASRAQFGAQVLNFITCVL